MRPTDVPEIPTTPEELIEAARKLRFEAGVLAAQADGKLNQAVAYERLAGLKSALSKDGLSTKDESNTLGTMNASPSSNALRSSAQLDANEDHLFVLMLKKKKITVATVADFLTEKLKRPVPRNTVQSWYKKPGDPGYRRIPEDAEEAIRGEYGVPRKAWAHVRPVG